MLTIVTWKWHPGAAGYTPLRVPYTAEHVNRLAKQIRQHYKAPHRMICVTDDPAGIAECETYPLWPDLSDLPNVCGPRLPSCYRRLKIFDPETTAAMGIKDGDPVVSIDLDMTIVGDLLPLWDRSADFVGWARRGSHRPRVYNGSMFRFRAGRLAKLWSQFDPARSPQEAMAARYMGSDQGWISYKLGPNQEGWTREDGVYSYANEMPNKAALPSNARVVVFHGSKKPWHPKVRAEAPWLRTGEPASFRRSQPHCEPVFVCMMWNDGPHLKRFGPDYVHRLQRGIARQYPKAHRFICVTDDPSGLDCDTFELWPDLADMTHPTSKKRRPCFRRLKLFDPDTQTALGLHPGDRLVWVDLDAVIVRDLSPIIDRDEDLILWRDQAYSPGGPVSPYNGSLVMVRAGTHAELWHDFIADPDAALARIRAAGIRGSDQAWLGVALGPDMPVWDRGDGVLWSRHIQSALPEHARMIFYCGVDDPRAARQAWVRQHWV